MYITPMPQLSSAPLTYIISLFVDYTFYGSYYMPRDSNIILTDIDNLIFQFRALQTLRFLDEDLLGLTDAQDDQSFLIVMRILTTIRNLEAIIRHHDPSYISALVRQTIED